MSDAIERPKTYEEGVRDGFNKGKEQANKVMEQMLHATCCPVVCDLPETEAVKLLQEHLQLYKKAFCLFVNWAEENDIGYENIDGYKYQEELDSKGLGYIEGMMYIALKEAKNEHSELYDKWIANVDQAISD
jgi:hypothetical protein